MKMITPIAPRRSGRGLLLALVVMSVAACSSVPSSRAIATDLDHLFDDLHQRQLFSGAVVVSRHGTLLYARGFGFADRERGTPFTPDTTVDGGSLAKTFTADLVLRLAGEGRVDLDAPLLRYVEGFPYADVTLRHLLAHSSGLVSDYAYFDPYLAPGTARTTEAMLAVIARERPPLAFPPGTAFEYNSLGYDLAALAAARVEGRTVEQSMRARYFSPLRLTSAFLRPARLADFPGVRTRGYALDGGNWKPNEVFEDEAFHGGSNIYISARDLDRWNAALLRSEPPAESLQHATIGDGSSGLTYGSWYEANAGDLIWYAGHLQGFHSRIVREKSSGLSIVYVTNNTLAPWLQPAIARAMRDVIAGRTPDPLVAPEVRPLAREELRPAEGDWATADGTLVIDERDGLLFVRREGVTYRAFRTAPGVFYVPGLDVTLAVRPSGLLFISTVTHAADVREEP